MNANFVCGRMILAFATVVLCSRVAAEPVTVSVNGTFVETVVAVALAGPHQLKVHAKDMVAGDLEGTGQLHIYSTEIVDPVLPHVANVLSTRRINTSEGTLFLAEVGERIGDDVSVISNVAGGTGRFKNATGQLILTGLHAPDGGVTIDFTYTGTIVLWL